MQGNILDDAKAVEVLSEATVISDDIQAKEADAEVAQRDISAARERYTACGDINAQLFFCVAAMAERSCMYLFSLPWLLDLFVRSIHESKALQVRIGS